MDQAKNFAKVTVSDGNYDSTSTSVDLITSDGGKLPATPFDLVWWNETDYPNPADAYHAGAAEIIRVTNISSDTLTITRAQQGTDAIDQNTPGKVYAMAQVWSAGDANNLTPISYNGTSMEIDTQTGNLTLGDVQDFGNGTKLAVNDSLNLVGLLGKFQTNQHESATVAVGTLGGKLAIYDGSGTLIGYLPIYDSIT